MSLPGLSTLAPSTSAGPSGAQGSASTATGAKSINIGGNPNVTSGALTPIAIVAAVTILAVWWIRRKG